MKKLAGAVRKNNILSKAVIIFSDRGYNNATTAELAKEVGVSEAALYIYFKNKNDILDHIFAGILKAFDRHISISLKNKESGMLSIRRLILCFNEFVSNNFKEIKILYNAYPENRATMHGWIKRIHSYIFDYLKCGVEDGSIRDDLDIDSTASVLVLLFIGMARRNLFWTGSEGMNDSIIQFCERSLAPLQPSEPSDIAESR